MTLTPDAARLAAHELEAITRAGSDFDLSEAAWWVAKNGPTALAALRAVAQGQEAWQTVDGRTVDMNPDPDVWKRSWRRVLIVPIEPTERSPSTNPGTPGT